MADEEAEEAEEEEDDDDDVFYAPSFVDRRRKRHKKNTGDDEDEEEEALNTKDVFGGTSSSSSSDDDDEKEEEEEEEEEETKKDARTRRKQKEEEEAGVVVSESESESDQSFPRKAALNTCNNVSRRERTTRAGAVDEKTREAAALMRELTKRTDAKILDEDEGEEEIAEKDEKGNNDDDDDDILSHYEPITLVFALSNTNKLELETCAKFTFKRIWTDFVSMHVLEGNAEKARLNFDGDVIKFDEDTPESLGMENDDCVDVIM